MAEEEGGGGGEESGENENGGVCVHSFLRVLFKEKKKDPATSSEETSPGALPFIFSVSPTFVDPCVPKGLVDTHRLPHIHNTHTHTRTHPQMLPRLTAPPCHQPRVVAVGASPRWPPRPACPPARAHAHSPAAHPTRSTRQVWVRASSEDKEATNPLAPLASTSASSAASASASSPDASSSPTSSSAPLPGVKIDLGLPRRSRRVSFTCNKCGES